MARVLLNQATALEQGEEEKEEETEAEAEATEEGAGEEEAGAEEDVWEQALESASSAPKPTAEDPEQTVAAEWVQLRIDGWLMISCPRDDWTMLAVRARKDV